MGIYDRDYVRKGGSGGSGGFMPAVGVRQTMRAWSMNTWIIAICITVFILDAALVSSGVIIPVKGAKFFKSDATSLQIDGAIPARDDQGRIIELYHQGKPFWPLIDPKQGVEIGRQEIMYMPPLQAALHFSTGKAFFQLEIWRLIGFQFLHGSLAHLLFNMLGLFFFGGIVEGYLGSKRYLAFYLITGMFGAVAYLFLNLIGFLGVYYLNIKMPGALTVDIFTPLIGASAGVFGVLMAVGFLAPMTTILLFFVIPMRVRTAAYGMVAFAAIDVFILAGVNAGGSAAHLGGAIAGYYFIRHTHLLRDFLDFFGFGEKGPRPKKAGSKKPKKSRLPRRSPSAEEIDRILDKVNDEGIHSLSNAERKALRRATESRR